MSDGYLWEDDDISYPDWSGRAQIDQRKTGDRASLEAIVGLDQTQWMAIGIDIGGGELDHDLRVIAVRRDLIPGGGDALPKIAQAHDGEIPATQFLIHDVDPYDVLRAMTHVLRMRLRARGTRDIPIRITAQADVPEQD